MGIVEQIYESAANAGLLKGCLWRPSDGSQTQRFSVGFAAPDDTVLDGLSLITEYAIEARRDKLRSFNLITLAEMFAIYANVFLKAPSDRGCCYRACSS